MRGNTYRTHALMRDFSRASWWNKYHNSEKSILISSVPRKKYWSWNRRLRRVWPLVDAFKYHSWSICILVGRYRIRSGHCRGVPIQMASCRLQDGFGYGPPLVVVLWWALSRRQSQQKLLHSLNRLLEGQRTASSAYQAIEWSTLFSWAGKAFLTWQS